MPEGEAHQLLARLQENAHFEGACKVVTIDGLRVEYPEGFGLLRASNTTPALMMRFEANDAESLKKIQTLFKIKLLAANQLLVLPI
jgi:phosphomannomutase